MLLGTYQPVPEYCPGLAACRHGLLQYRISIANGTEDCVHGFPCVWVGGCVCVFHCVSALFQCGQGDNSLDLWFNTVLCTVECVGVCMMRHRGVQIYLRMKSCGM